MARAALLNLKGTQYQGAGISPTLSDITLGSLQTAASPNLELAFNQLGLGQSGQISPIGTTSPLSTQDAFLHGGISSQEISALSVNMPPRDTLSSRNAQIPSQSLRLHSQGLAADAPGLFDEQTELQLALMDMQGARARAQNGYTPVEQLILQAHVRQQRAHAGASHQINPTARTANTRSLNARVGRSANNGQGANRRLLDFLPSVSEDDFHATAALLHNQHMPSQTMPADIEQDAFPRIAHDLPGAARGLDLERQAPLSGQHTRQRNHTLATQVRHEVDGRGHHIRSSTLPTQYLNHRNASGPSNANIPLYDSSISLADNISNNSSRRTSNIVHANDLHFSNTQPSLYSPPSGLMASRTTSSISSSTITDTQTLFTSKNNVNIPSAVSRKSKSSDAGAQTSSPPATSIIKAPSGLNSISSTSRPGGASISATSTSQDADDEDEGSSVVSPALTYSARTPASLSPATPYSGFFSESGETFKNGAINVAGTICPVGDVQPDMGEVTKVPIQGVSH